MQLVFKMISLQSVIFLIVLTGISALYEGDDCFLQSNGEIGKCISVDRCEEAKKLLQSNRRPQHCGFNRHTELVCCVQQQALQKNPGYKSDKMCEKYKNAATPPWGIANGEKAGAEEFPHMAAIGYSDGKKILWLCGGSLISEQFILTAAHCASSEEYGPPTVIRLGDLNLSDKRDDAQPENSAISQIIVNPLYKKPSVYHDIALIKLEDPVRFDLYVQPACLHYLKDVPVKILQAIGFGKTDLYGESSSHLMKVNLTTISYEQCAQRYPKEARRMKNGIVDDMQICAGDNEGGDTCPGDSGGPLHFLRTHKDPQILPHFAIVGITSFGKGCGTDETVGVYIRVAPYIQWIEEIVWT